MTEKFTINKKSYHIENIYCSIDIINIEKYLKRIEIIENSNKHKIKIILIKNDLLYSKNQLNWAIYIANNRFIDKLNISKNELTETLMILSITNQIKSISNDFLLSLGKNSYFLNIISDKKLTFKQIEAIKKELEINVEKSFKANEKKIINFYKIKDAKNIEKEIIEKMALSLYN